MGREGVASPAAAVLGTGLAADPTLAAGGRYAPAELGAARVDNGGVEGVGGVEVPEVAPDRRQGVGPPSPLRGFVLRSRRFLSASSSRCCLRRASSATLARSASRALRSSRACSSAAFLAASSLAASASALARKYSSSSFRAAIVPAYEQHY